MSFASLYAHGFARVAACTTDVYVADPARNAASVIEVSQQLSAEGVAVAVLPELTLTGYAVDDLLGQDALLDAVLAGLADIVEASTDLMPVIIVGAPLRHQARLFNTAVVIHRGRVLGVVPKIHLPTYREFYERRQFASGDGITGLEITIAGQRAPFGTDLLFAAADVRGLTVGVEICEDMFVPVPPSSGLALAGATVLVNLSGSPITIGRGRHPQRPVPDAVDALPGRLPVRRRRSGRVDHRPVLGRPDQHLRERAGNSGRGPLRGGSATDHRRHRSRPAAPGAGPAGHLRGQPAGGEHPSGVPDRRVHSRAAGRRPRSAPGGRAFPLRPGRSRPAGPGLLRGLQHPGRRPGPAAPRDQHREGRDRCLRRTGLHPCADRRRPGNGPARAAADQHPRLHDAGLRHRRRHQGQRLEADEGAGCHRAGAGHPADGAGRC